MNSIYRTLDANINRVSEGLRALEDLLRFASLHPQAQEELRNLRHSVRKKTSPLIDKCLSGRNTEKDPGVVISANTLLDQKSSKEELCTANFKRVQEGLRTIEENLKLIDQNELSKLFETMRFSSYKLEKEVYPLVKSKSSLRFPQTDIYCLTAEEFSKGRNNIQVVEQMLRADIKLIQYREKEKKPGEMYSECMEIRRMTRDAGATFIVNDHIDIAMACEADGIHIGQEDLPLEVVRDLTGGKMLIGLSTHSPEQAMDAKLRGADYIGVGPIYTTYTKKDVCDAVGLEYLEYVVANVDIPFVAIGGIKEHNLAEIMSRGAKCAALVTEIVGTDDIADKIQRLRKIIADIKN